MTHRAGFQRRPLSAATRCLAVVAVLASLLVVAVAPAPEASAESAACGKPLIGLSNGGFEAPVLTPGSSSQLPSSTPGLVWKNLAEPLVEVWSSGKLGVSSAEGQQFAEMNATMSGTLYQDISTDPGTKMVWNLKHRGRQGPDTMNVLVGRPGGPLVPSGGP